MRSSLLCCLSAPAIDGALLCQKKPAAPSRAHRSWSQNALEGVGDGIAPVAAEGAGGDLDPRRRLPSFVLGQIDHAPDLSDRAKMIKLADKICNVGDMLHAPPADWSLKRKLEYLSWSEAVVAGCRGANAALEARFDEVLAQARRAFAGES